MQSLFLGIQNSDTMQLSGGVFSSCNAVHEVNQATLAVRCRNHRFFDHSLNSRRLGNGVVSFSSVVARKGSPVLCSASSVVTDGQVNCKQAVIDPGLVNQLRLGSLSEDGYFYKEKFIVRCYEVGINKTATVETIANLLQEVGCNHAQSVGFSTDGFATTTTMRKLHLIWVTARMHIEIYRYPAWSDVVEIETWCQGEGRIGTRRDWIIKDFATDEVIGRATSKWVMMNMDTRRLQKVSDDVRDEHLIYFPKALRLAFPEENNASLKKIAKLRDPALHSILGLMPRRADLDMNQHVNNVAYIGWVLESIPQEVIDNYELETITLDYRRECQRDDIVDSLTSPEPVDDTAFEANNGSAPGGERRNLLHLLRTSGNGLEINRGRTEWRKKTAKK